MHLSSAVASPVSIDPDWAWRLSPLGMAEKHGKGWQTTRHHAVIDREFRRLLTDPTVDCLILKAPPRHGKTEYLSKWGPAWYLLANPDKRVMLNSYTMSLAKYNSRWVRDTVHRLAPLWDLRGVDPGAARADDWSLRDTGGGLLASGVNGSQTGRGAHLILIDDYLRSAKDAMSETVRDAQWEWLKGTISTRREPGGKLVILATQWHSDDLIGRLMSKRDEIGLNIRCITLQALREDNGTPDPLRRQPGEALWPDRWPAATLDKQKRFMGPFWWSAQYQGNPGASGWSEWPASYFSNIWVPEGEFPTDMQLSALYCDPSKGKNSKRGDYSAIVYAGYRHGKMFIKSSIDRRPASVIAWDMARMALQLKPWLVGFEENAFQFLLAPDWVAACEELGYGVTEPFLINNTIGKNIRINRLDAWFRNRELMFERSASNELLIAQAKAWPFGTHDDGPDALEGVLRLLVSHVEELQERAEPENTYGRRPV